MGFCFLFVLIWFFSFFVGLPSTQWEEVSYLSAIRFRQNLHFLYFVLILWLIPLCSTMRPMITSHRLVRFHLIPYSLECLLFSEDMLETTRDRKLTLTLMCDLRTTNKIPRNHQEGKGFNSRLKSEYSG